MVSVDFHPELFGAKLLEVCLGFGLIILPCGDGSSVSITPALNISNAQIKAGVLKLKSAVEFCQKISLIRINVKNSLLNG